MICAYPYRKVSVDKIIFGIIVCKSNIGEKIKVMFEIETGCKFRKVSISDMHLGLSLVLGIFAIYQFL